jgi:hypothetical protein
MGVALSARSEITQSDNKVALRPDRAAAGPLSHAAGLSPHRILAEEGILPQSFTGYLLGIAWHGGLLYAAGVRIYLADTNNHAVRVADLTAGSVATFEFRGLELPGTSLRDQASPRPSSRQASAE